MRNYRIVLALVVLVLASLACQALAGSGNKSPTVAPLDDGASSPEAPTAAAPTQGNSTDNTPKTDFPMTEDAYNVTELNGSLIFYTKLSLDDTMKFYRDEYASRGYTERESLTVVSDGTFSMVFDGDPSGKAVVIQSVDLGGGIRTVSIRLEDV
ncbi:MAG TPA: hypothetical protein VK206_27200 [Anaerolineales bacterium]|nr:hypothetical protein [Anaerolineales bacterium]HLO28937.1 hypothetical protein [Anaerolineales bacterium]